MSQDHKPSREDEAQRIRDAGGFIINNRFNFQQYYFYFDIIISVSSSIFPL